MLVMDPEFPIEDLKRVHTVLLVMAQRLHEKGKGWVNLDQSDFDEATLALQYASYEIAGAINILQGEIP